LEAEEAGIHGYSREDESLAFKEPFVVSLSKSRDLGMEVIDTYKYEVEQGGEGRKLIHGGVFLIENKQRRDKSY